MASLSINTGTVEYDINGRETVRFNPTDTLFFRRLIDVVDRLDAECRKAQEEESKAAEAREKYEIMARLDDTINGQIDDLFRRPGLCSHIFCDGDDPVSPNALCDGFPLWVNFLLAVYDEADESVKKQQKIANAKISKYTQKYHK